MDNYASAIISNEHNCFTGKFTPTTTTLETAEGMATKTKLVGTILLVLTNNKNVNHVYIIPRFVLNPEIPIKTLGIPTLGKFFVENENFHNPFSEDGTTTKLGVTKSHFTGSRQPRTLFYARLYPIY